MLVILCGCPSDKPYQHLLIRQTDKEEASAASSSADCCKYITGQIHNKAEKTQGKRSRNNKHTQTTHQ